MAGFVAHAPEGLPEVGTGDDLAALVVQHLDLEDGDLVVVTSKVVSKAEGRVQDGDRDAAIAAETRRVVAARGTVRIVENRLGVVMAAAGVDASNVAAGTVALLPVDPDATARRLRCELAERTGRNVGVVVTDTAGRPWRTGQTDLAIGLAGLLPTEPFAGRTDGHGNELAVTEPAVADEVAAAAELASGKLGARPLVRVRGLGRLVLPPGQHGPGAVALQRPRAQDLFALGTREAVVAAVAGAGAELFGPPATSTELREALATCGIGAVPERGSLVVPTDDATTVATCAVLARAHGWSAEPADGRVSLRPAD